MTTPLAYAIDTLALDVYVNRSSPSDQNLPAMVRPYLTICMEPISKRVLAFCLSEYHIDLESIKAILYEAFLADGEQFVSVPDEIWFDKGLLFSSLQDLTHALHITQCSMPPSAKGSVERLFLSIQNECFPRQDSSGNRFIAESTLSEIEERFIQFLLHHHHQVQPSTGLAPLESWQEQRRPSVFDPHVLYPLLHNGGKRRVLKNGIRYRHNTYWHSDLAYYVGKEIQIMMKPKQISPETIEGFFEQRWICSASSQEGANGDHLRNENERI